MSITSNKLILGLFTCGLCALLKAEQPATPQPATPQPVVPPPTPPPIHAAPQPGTPQFPPQFPPPNALPPAPAPAPAAPPSNAKIQFETPVYDFGKVKCGDLVKYTYIFTNTGSDVLEVTHVQPSCGCTTAGEWTRKVDPGKTGAIPVQFNSQNFNGQVFKTVSVNCNDKQQPTVMLQLKGTIWKPIDLSPPYTVLTIPPDAGNASTVVKITVNMDQPVDVFEPESNNKAFAAELKTNAPGKEFQLTISTVPPVSTGNLQAKITLKTSATNTPTLEVPFWANIQPAILIMPPQLQLPASPLASKMTPSITIQNNSTNQLAITEPAVNLPGVEVQVKEMQPGRMYSVVLSFPEGFEIPAGQQIAFTAKSSLTQSPTIRVPIVQPMRPPMMAPATPGALPGVGAPQRPTIALPPAPNAKPVPAPPVPAPASGAQH
jgi:hypothetical protein